MGKKEQQQADMNKNSFFSAALASGRTEWDCLYCFFALSFPLLSLSFPIASPRVKTSPRAEEEEGGGELLGCCRERAQFHWKDIF